MSSFQEKIQEQVKQGKTPTICFFDIDGTIFTPDIRIVKAPYYNLQTYNLLQKSHIPLVLITGRFTWSRLRDLEVALEGFPKPDVIIFGAGTEIYIKDSQDTYQRDTNWLKGAALTVTPDAKIFKKITPYLYVANVVHISVSALKHMIDTLEKQYQKQANIFYSESLVKGNTRDTFSGSVYLASAHASKKDAVAYILKMVSSDTLHVYIYGDSSVDIPMLSLPSSKKITIYPYLVHPTPLAREDAKKHPTITVREDEGPRVILETLTNALNKSHFSREQNSPLRRVEKYIEPLLDRIVDKDLSANDISFLGVKKLKEGVDLVEKKTFLKSFQGFTLYGQGNLTDILDGIRARRKGKTKEGQLVDGFCDRVKEFYQLYTRGKARMEKNQEKGLETYKAALSCSLPSLARAQAEMEGIIVPEKDPMGGSMIDRTKLLIRSFLYHMFGLEFMSYAIDEEIYKRNIATFENRLQTLSNKKTITFPNIKVTSELQQKAVERFLVYAQVLQEAYAVIGKEVLKKELPLIHPYLEVPVEKLRKTYHLENYHLSLKKILFT